VVAGDFLSAEIKKGPLCRYNVLNIGNGGIVNLESPLDYLLIRWLKMGRGFDVEFLTQIDTALLSDVAIGAPKITMLGWLISA